MLRGCPLRKRVATLKITSQKYSSYSFYSHGELIETNERQLYGWCLIYSANIVKTAYLPVKFFSVNQKSKLVIIYYLAVGVNANSNLTTCFFSSIEMVMIYLIRPYLVNVDRGSNTR